MPPSSVASADDSEPPPVIWWIVGVGLGLLLLGLGYAYLTGAFRAEPDYAIANIPSVHDPRFALTLEGLANSADTTGRLVGFWPTVDEVYAARAAGIRQAEHLIQYETYFMTPGHRANAFAEVITDRALAGVKVQLLFDHQGTQDIPAKYWQRLRNVGIESAARVQRAIAPQTADY